MNRIMKRFLAVCVCLALFASYGFSLAEDAPDSRIARKENVYETAKQIFDELMRQYADEEIDGATYAQRMMELTTSAQEEIDEE